MKKYGVVYQFYFTIQVEREVEGLDQLLDYQPSNQEIKDGFLDEMVAVRAYDPEIDKSYYWSEIAGGDWEEQDGW